MKDDVNKWRAASVRKEWKPEGVSLSTIPQLIHRINAVTMTIPAGVSFCGNAQAHPKFTANSSLKEQTIWEETVYRVFKKVTQLFFTPSKHKLWGYVSALLRE